MLLSYTGASVNLLGEAMAESYLVCCGGVGRRVAGKGPFQILLTVA